MRLLQLVMSAMLITGLAGCQSTSSPRELWRSMSGQPTAQASWTDPNAATIHCSGGLGCAFERIDDVSLLTEDGQRQPAAMRARLLRPESPDGLSDGYYLQVVAGTHQVRAHFYPVTKARAEHFALIHDFKAGKDYRLHLFRQRQAKVASVLARATPDPLCIEVLEDQQQVRLFCRPFDPATGLGEFVETSILKK